nr:LytTR family DNA-binding domain-containing protein [Facklamia miroungae]
MGKQHVLELDDLILVEVNKRELRLVLADQDLLIPGTLARFKESLDQRFVAPHRSYLVNLNHVESMGKEEVILSSGVKVPLSRRSAKSIQKAFIDHYKGSAFYD